MKALLEEAGDAACDKYVKPEPRVELGTKLRGIANAMIDISDGLLADARHIASASQCEIRIELEQVPFSDIAQARQDFEPLSAVTGGDDYELCFTASEEKGPQIDSLAAELGLNISRIGRIEAETGLRVTEPDGGVWSSSEAGFDHFVDKDGADD